jgi:hypothetical protein
LQAAQSFAGRVLKDAGADTNLQIERAYRLAFGRKPAAEEVKAAVGFLERQAALIKPRIEAKQPVALPANCPGDVDQARAAALVDFCHVLFNSNEFVYVN